GHRAPRKLPALPTRRSSDLAVPEVVRQLQLHRLVGQRLVLHGEALDDLAQRPALEARRPERADEIANLAERALQQPHGLPGALLDRKSTRLNSSHVSISYAV